jgi:hypothetical protein
MPSIEAQLGAAVQDLKRSLTPAQLDQVLNVINIAISADRNQGRSVQPDKPLPVKVVK